MKPQDDNEPTVLLSCEHLHVLLGQAVAKGIKPSHITIGRAHSVRLTPVDAPGTTVTERLCGLKVTWVDGDTIEIS